MKLVNKETPERNVSFSALKRCFHSIIPLRGSYSLPRCSRSFHLPPTRTRSQHEKDEIRHTRMICLSNQVPLLLVFEKENRKSFEVIRLGPSLVWLQRKIPHFILSISLFVIGYMTSTSTRPPRRFESEITPAY